MPVFDCNAVPQENFVDLVEYLVDSVGAKGDAAQVPDVCTGS
jgi:hypothetical protein